MTRDELRKRAVAGVDRMQQLGRYYRETVAVDAETLLALLDVAQAAEDIASPDYRNQPPPYATGIRVEEAVALTDAVDRLWEVTS